MGMMLAITCGAMITLGACLVALGLRHHTRLSTESSTTLWTSVARWWTSLSPRSRWWLLSSVAIGVAVAVVFNWPLGIVLVPALLILLPLLLSPPQQREIEILSGLDRWVRLISTSLASGKSIRDAIFTTRGQVPPVLREPVSRLCTRLDQRWTVRDALFGMADELSSADTDAVVAAMAVAAARGAGSRATLEALSDSIQARLRALREIASERAKPRVVAIQVTIITLVVLPGIGLVNPGFFMPYTTPLGQLIAAALTLAYLGCLVMLRRRMVPPPAPRFLRSSS